MRSFSQFLIEKTAYDDAKDAWLKGHDSEHLSKSVKHYISRFKFLKSVNSLKGSEGDISNWVKKPFSYFMDFVDKKLEEYNSNLDPAKKAKASDYKIVYQDGPIVVYHIKSWAASCKMGTRTDWCISKKGRDNEHHWDRIAEAPNTIYFVFNNATNEKWAVIVPPDENEEGIFLYDQEDCEGDYDMFKEYIVDYFKIPEQTFKFREE